MEKDSHLQLELFSEGARPQPIEPSRADNAFVNLMRACEKKAWLCLAFIIVTVIAFSIGVERGRRLGIRARNPSRGMAIAATTADQVSGKVAAPHAAPGTKNKAVSVKGAYTIQLATYTKSEYAEEQVKQLKTKGYPAVLVKSGGHTLVCVGAFTDKEAAKRYAARFKGTYKSCLIRRF